MELYNLILSEPFYYKINLKRRKEQSFSLETVRTQTIPLSVLSCHSFLSWEQKKTTWLCIQPLYSLNSIPLLPLVIYIAFSHKGQFWEIHLTVVKRDGGYNNLINVLESMLIQMEESFLLLNSAAVWLQAALASVD